MKQHYTQTFKNKVLNYAEKNGTNKAAEEFEVSIQSIRNWRQRLSTASQAKAASAPDGNVRVVLTLSRANARDIARQYLADTLVNDKPI